MPCANGIWSVGGRNWNEDFEMLADDCNCTGHFGVDAFVWLCMGLIYISGLVLGLLSTVIALLGVAVYYLFPEEWCNFAGLWHFD